MAGGEKAKSSGEYGEQIVKNILELMGWNNANSGVTVPCVHKEKHKKENSKQILPARGRGRGICEKILIEMKNKTAAKLSITGFAAVFMFLKCQIQDIILKCTL